MYTHAAGGEGGGGSFAASPGMAAGFTPATPSTPDPCDCEAATSVRGLLIRAASCNYNRLLISSFLLPCLFAVGRWLGSTVAVWFASWPHRTRLRTASGSLPRVRASVPLQVRDEISQITAHEFLRRAVSH
jgi:hypothetical protein